MRRTLILVLLVMSPGATHANGRPPVTNGVYFHPSEPQTLFVRTTFGLLVSKDEGCTFRWICEQNVGYGGTFDPKYAIGPDGTIYATTFTGLRVSHDGGCSFSTATSELAAGTPGRIADIWIDALDLGPDGEVWVGTSESTVMTNGIYRSTDRGMTFEKRGDVAPTIWWRSIQVAPSDPTTLYATGIEPAGTQPTQTVHLVRTEDAGETWTPVALTGVTFGSSPGANVVGIDPTDPAIVYLVSLESNGATGDRLYRSSDRGTTFTQVLVTDQRINDVVIAGPQVTVATKGGALRSTDRGVSFSALSGPLQFECLGQRADGAMFGCGANWQPDFKAVGRSSDGASWDKVFRFVELEGAVECPAGTPQADQCAPMWPALQQQFAATGSTCGAPPPDGPAVDATPASPGGCCEAGAGPAGPFGLSLGLLALLRRRRRSTAS